MGKDHVRTDISHVERQSGARPDAWHAVPSVSAGSSSGFHEGAELVRRKFDARWLLLIDRDWLAFRLLEF